MVTKSSAGDTADQRPAPDLSHPAPAEHLTGSWKGLAAGMEHQREAGERNRVAVLDFIRQFWAANCYSPTYREIAAGCGLGLTTVFGHAQDLADAGKLRLLPGNRGPAPTGMRVVFDTDV